MVKEYYFKEGCYIQELHNIDGDQDCSIAHVRVEPKQTTRLHALKNTRERYVILAGHARVTIGQKSWLVKAKDVVQIDENTPQKIENLLGEDLLFLAVCTPRFKEKNYYEVSSKME